MRILLAAALLLACGKSQPDRAETAKLDFIVKDTQRDLPVIKAAIAAHAPESVEFKCAGPIAGLPDLKTDASYADLAKDVDQTCFHDLPVAFLDDAATKAEAARKAKPDEKVLRECFSGEYITAVDHLKKHGREDDAAKAIEARFEAVCPKTK